jgi:hypothetical protein
MLERINQITGVSAGRSRRARSLNIVRSNNPEHRPEQQPSVVYQRVESALDRALNSLSCPAFSGYSDKSESI